MDKVKEIAVIKVLAPYLMAFPMSKANEGTLLIYARALEDLPIELIDASMQILLKTSKFWPSISDIREAAESLMSTATGTEAKGADEAWREVLGQVHDAFIYKKPTFSSQEIELAALNMGWTALCELPTDQINTARAQFRRSYEAILARKNTRINNHQVLDSLPKNSELRQIVQNSASKMIIGGVSK